MTDLALFGYYSFRARLQPAFLALVPIAVSVLAWTKPGALWPSVLWSLLGSAGGSFLLANTARNLGKSIEPELWRSWGGAPTTQLLRHSGPGNAVLRERWHRQLTKLMGKPLPTAEEERDNPAHADDIYEAATRLLIGKTRSSKDYPFVYRDNVNYGFCRNLFALRGIGLTATIGGFLVNLAACYWSLASGKVDFLPIGCAFVDCGLLLWWCFICNGKWVKVPAMNYAQHLLECTEKLTRSKPKSMPK